MGHRLPLGFSPTAQRANLACAFLLISGMEESRGLERQSSGPLVSVSEWQYDWVAGLDCAWDSIG